MATPWRPAGTVVQSRFRLERRLGGRGLGDVWLAKDLRPPTRELWVKLLALEGERSDERLQGLLEHCAVLSRVHFRNTAAVLEFGAWEGGAFLVYEPLEDAPLTVWLDGAWAQGEGPGLVAIQRVFEDVCVALEDLHRATPPRVHGGLTCEGVAVGFDPEGALRATVLDVGLARFVPPVWPPEYLAPELEDAPEEASQASDVFSLGVLFMELVTPHRPSRGDLLRAPWRQAVLSEERRVREEIARVRAGVPDAVWDVIARCLRRAPSQRPADAGQLRTLLQRAWHPGGPSLPEPSPGVAVPHVVIPALPPRPMAALPEPPALPEPEGSPWASPDATDGEDTTVRVLPHDLTVKLPAPERPRASSSRGVAAGAALVALALLGGGGYVWSTRHARPLHATAPALSGPAYRVRGARTANPPVAPSLPESRRAPLAPPAPLAERPATPSEPRRAPSTAAERGPERGSERNPERGSERGPTRSAVTSLPWMLSRAQVASVLEPLSGAVRGCARGQTGTAPVTLVVGGHGRVLRATPGGSFAGTPEGECIARVVRDARFPAFRATQATIAWPYVVVPRR